jgi:pilus assembly protein CpaB
MKRRVIGMLAAVVLAGIGTAVLIAYVQGAQNRALAGEELVDVLVVSAPISRSTSAADIGGLVESERVPLKLRAEGSVTDIAQLEGQVAAVDLVPGEQVVAARFIPPAQLAEQRSIQVPEGLQEVTVSLEPQRAVGGQINPGDTVGLFASFAPDLTPYSSQMLLNKLLVTNVQVEQLPGAITGDDGLEVEGPALAPTGNLLITLAVDVADAERTIFAAEHGSIWLSAEPAGAGEGGSRLRNPENIYND